MYVCGGRKGDGLRFGNESHIECALYYLCIIISLPAYLCLFGCLSICLTVCLIDQQPGGRDRGPVSDQQEYGMSDICFWETKQQQRMKSICGNKTESLQQCLRLCEAALGHSGAMS